MDENELRRKIEEGVELESKKRTNPLPYIVGPILVFLMIIMIFPYYSIKLDPRPTKIPTINEVNLFTNTSGNTTLVTYQDFVNFMEPENRDLKTFANRIVSYSCAGERVCHAKALYYFVRDRFNYIADPVDFEYVEMPQDFVLSGGGDCESGTLFLANLMEAVGIDAELVLIPSHAFLRIRLPQALNRYKKDGDYVYLDWTCKNCEFGEVPISDLSAKAIYINV